MAHCGLLQWKYVAIVTGWYCRCYTKLMNILSHL